MPFDYTYDDEIPAWVSCLCGNPILEGQELCDECLAREGETETCPGGRLSPWRDDDESDDSEEEPS